MKSAGASLASLAASFKRRLSTSAKAKPPWTVLAFSAVNRPGRGIGKARLASPRGDDDMAHCSGPRTGRARRATATQAEI